MSEYLIPIIIIAVIAVVFLFVSPKSTKGEERKAKGSSPKNKDKEQKRTV